MAKGDKSQARELANVLGVSKTFAKQMLKSKCLDPWEYRKIRNKRKTKGK